jgi:hypothetical protein
MRLRIIFEMFRSLARTYAWQTSELAYAIGCSDSASMREEHFSELIRSLLACRDNGRPPAPLELSAVRENPTTASQRHAACVHV